MATTVKQTVKVPTAAEEVERLVQVLSTDPIRPHIELVSSDEELERPVMEEVEFKKPSIDDSKPYAVLTIELHRNKMNVKVAGEWVRVTRRVTDTLAVHVNRVIDDRRKMALIERRKELSDGTAG